MSQPILSLCIPSRREWARAERAIGHALLYCTAGESELVVSDNAGDPHKHRQLQALAAQHKQLRHLPSSHNNAHDNWANALQASQGQFSAFLSDDDTLVRHSSAPLPYQRQPGLAGYQANFAYLKQGEGLVEGNGYSVVGKSALERLQAYSRLCKHHNTSLYAAWDRQLLASIFLDTLALQPHKSGLGDWPLVNALISSGNLLHDPSSTLFYSLDNWADLKTTQQSLRTVLRHSPIGEHNFDFTSFFLAIDSFILTARANSPLPLLEKLEAANYLLMGYLKMFIALIQKTERNQGNTALQDLCTKLAAPDTLRSKLHDCLRLIDLIQPELTEGYRAYYLHAMDCAWGEVK